MGRKSRSFLRRQWPAIVLVAASLLIAAPGQAAEQESDILLDLRWRYETVDADASPDAARAATLRTRLGLEHAFSGNWSGLVEFEDVHVLGADDYNDTKNGLGQYPVVADPEDTELNRLQLSWQGGDDTATFGRQRINLGSQRFIGAVGFRQNEQTYDGLRYDMRAEASDVTFLYLARVNRIFGAHHPSRANIDLDAVVIDANWDLAPFKLGAYAHGFEFEASPGASVRNVGLRVDWKGGGWKLSGEVAQQDGWRDGLLDEAVDYRKLEVESKLDRFSWAIGQELLGSNGSSAFQTPFATLHKFNGWADQFLTTPGAGLEDTYVRVVAPLSSFKLHLQYHQFAADALDQDYGDEFDIAISRMLEQGHAEGVTVELKYAAFSGDVGYQDVSKLWLTLAKRF